MTPIEIKLPNIGIDEVEITEILVKVGDRVESEQSVITVEGDKASMEIPSPKGGIVREIKVSVGDKIETGKLIMVFDPPERELGIACTEKEKKDYESMTVPVSMVSLVSPKKEVQSSQEVQQAIPLLEGGGNEESNFPEKNIHVHTTPLIRRLAREIGIDLAKIKGTGRKGRIVREDVQTYVKDAVRRSEISSATTAISGVVSSSSVSASMKVDFSKFGEVEEIDLSRIQKISGANLSRNWSRIPHVTHFDKADITDLEIFRKKQNLDAEKAKLDRKYTPVVFIMKAVAVALERMPRFNSSLSEDGLRLILKKYINIGVAVDTKNGLVVPVFKDVNKKGLTELSYELTKIFKKARDGNLASSEMQGGCFTISSIGVLGTTYFSPIINAPEVAILGVSKSEMEPVWNGKEFIPRLMLPMSLSFDHRVIDGADGARFIRIIGNILSDIRYLLI